MTLRKMSCLACLLLFACVAMDSECADGLLPSSLNDSFQLDLINDSDDTLHFTVDGEARAPSNRLLPGASRMVTIRYTPGGSVLVTVGSSTVPETFTGCTISSDEFDPEANLSSVVIYSGAPNYFTCSGPAFE